MTEQERFDLAFEQHFPNAYINKQWEVLAQHFYNGCFTMWQAAIELHGEHARLNILESNLKTHTYDADKFVVVPVEPTDAMQKRGNKLRFSSNFQYDAASIYESMIQAAQEGE